MQTSFWLIVFIIGLVQGALLSGALLAMKTGNRRATVVLAALVAVFTAMILAEVIERVADSPLELLLTGVSINTELAIGPLLLLFARAVLYPDRSFGIADGRHFVPMLIGLTMWLVLTGALYFGVLDLTELTFRRIVAGYVVLKAAFLFGYLVVAYRVLTRGLSVDAQRFVSGRQPVEMRWLGHWLIWLGLLAGLIYLTFFLGYFGVPVPESDDIGSLLLAFMIYLLSLLVLLRPWVLSVQPRQVDLNRYAADIRRLEEHLEQRRTFLDPELTLRKLAEALALTENRLSAVLNDGMQTSFYDLMARCRLAEFERLARDPHHRDCSVLELAYAAGFNSKASFYRLFRRLRGTTPSSFRKHAVP